MTNSDLCKRLKECPTFQQNIDSYEVVKYIEENKNDNDNVCVDNINGEIINDKKIHVPYDFQIEAYNTLKDQHRSILNTPCGTGKTFIATRLSESYTNIVIFSPLLAFSEQNLNVFCQQLPQYKTHLINSEGTRKFDNIKVGEYNIFSATYKSADLIYQILLKIYPKMETLMKDNEGNEDMVECNTANCLIIIDEFHNLSKNNISDEEDIMHKILSIEYEGINFLYMSATPKLYYDGENKLETKLFGDVIYKYSVEDALKNGYINNYQIITPDDYSKDKYDFLYHNMLFHGYKKCIVFMQSVEEAKKFESEFINVNARKYNIDLFVDVIVSNTKRKARQEILNNFTSNQYLSIIIAVHILDECIDIPLCDSVYLSYDSKIKIRTIQRVFRCLRKSEDKPTISGIFMYYDSRNNDIFNELKEYNVHDKNTMKIKQKIVNKENKKGKDKDNENKEKEIMKKNQKNAL